MQLFHNSQSVFYKQPFGAVPTDSVVRLSLAVHLDGDEEIESVCLRVWARDEETFYDMKKSGMAQDKAGYSLYSTEIKTPSDGTLMWYYFLVKTKSDTYYYTNNDLSLGGIGDTLNLPENHSYQITVYDKDYKTPKWFKSMIMYQIFTDRFCGDHSETGGVIPKKRDEYIIHSDWYEPIAFNPHPYEQGPACNDFYGGNLKGIIEKLPYLKSLGVGVIYLNPIFDAYSNHKYDTADYKNIDPMFGTNEIFTELCQKAEKMGIRIILDGVFSHTGADSVYFNKYGTYGLGGAYHDGNSPYREWYNFGDNSSYESWWGCSNLPNVREMTPSYLDYILRDENSVVKTWIERGASGYRLDVADELPDEFIKILRQEVKKKDSDAVIIGEVWEDASNKVAYSLPREYLLGYELDSVMNYPFKDNMIAFMLGTIDAKMLDKKMMSIFENYPKQTLYALMNIIGTHDTMRIKSLMGGLNQDCGDRRLSSGCEQLATYRVKLLSFIQMTYVGVPCIYYGDEVGMQGGRDPFNRGTYPWRAVDPDLREWYTKLCNVRNNTDCLKLGEYKTLYASGGVYVYARYISGGKDAFGDKASDGLAICAVNRNFESAKAVVDISGLGEYMYFMRGIDEKSLVTSDDNKLEIELMPLGCEIFIGSDKF